MAKNRLEAQVEKDILRFKESGHLPKAYDVLDARRGMSGYWDYVGGRLSGLEPLGNSDMAPVRSDTPTSTEKGKRFAQWLTQEFPTLPEESREIFNLVFRQGLEQKAVAQIMRLSPSTVERRLRKLRATIARFVGIVNYL